MKRYAIVLMVFAATLAAATPVAAGGRPLKATLSGAAEIPGPGDPDGSGIAYVTLNHGRNQVCFHLEVSDIDDVTGAHIHSAPAGLNGGVVVNLNIGVNGFAGCVPAVDGDLILEIAGNPADYYINVHTEAFPAGAIRGQLGRATGKPPAPPSSRPAQIPGNPIYLALGDSWAWGQGVASGTESTAGYAGQLHVALQSDLDCSPAASDEAADGCARLQFVSLARPARPGFPGVKAPEVSAEQLPVAVPLLESRNGDSNPRNDVEVITLHVGGNDVAGPIQLACLGGFNEGCIAVWIEEMAQFESDLRAVVSALRSAAGTETPIVLGTYDNPAPYCFLFDLYGPDAILLGAALLEGFEAPLPGGGVLPLDGVNAIVRRVAGDYDADVAEVFGSMLGVDFVGGGDCLHLVESGHDKVTDAFLTALGL